MISVSTNIISEISSPVRRIGAIVCIYQGEDLIDTYSYNDKLKSFTVEKVNENSKFFGYGVCQKINVKLIDKDRLLDITTNNSIEAHFCIGTETINTLPRFYVTEVHRNENTNELSITAYDLIYKSSKRTVSELTVSSYTVREFAESCATLIGASALDVQRVDEAETCFDTSYSEGANFDGTESIREALDAIADVTQTIYYIDKSNNLVFKRLEKNANPDLIISKDMYITLDSKTNRRLSKIYHTTELGDDVYSAIEESGTTQYVRDNPFWELREDIGTLIDSAISAVGGLTINQFECAWRGNFLLEVGDKINIVTKDNGVAESFFLNDTMEYNGTLSQKTSWSYADNELETADNPSTIGDALKKTYARVDKVNKQINLVASDTDSMKDSISSLQINTEKITSTVQQMEINTNNQLESMNENLSTINKKVEASMTAEDITLAIKSELSSNGATSVTTETGFTFDENGLTIDKSDSSISTTITEDGMTVYREDEAVLVANNAGVDAANLHATTYLIIGLNSRFEDYDNNTRTGCFWIGS